MCHIDGVRDYSNKCVDQMMSSVESEKALGAMYNTMSINSIFKTDCVRPMHRKINSVNSLGRVRKKPKLIN